ncbi:biliverdin-producing heme oxygenase [Novosphingobium flavum]|uniref:Biliverdin-producing heme oxygenase n=1 Tax=Novosphingobium flavum TaxID=1778672 RepID=A0A7X1KN14_9SPHN|nr:biliverdin-producing heme oxygenase [Novosphingobium flavum]
MRPVLRAATSAAHDLLDSTVGALDLAAPADYARFLRIQFVARAALEPELAAHLGDLAPPSQLGLLRADLAALGAEAPHVRLACVIPATADPLGACWALAGSHLGNRAMLHGLGAQAGADWPTSFLADEGMAAYWKGLRPRLDRPAAADDPAIESAQAVFALFLAAVRAEGVPPPAKRAAA